jgi:hypothetical protein
MSTNQYRAAQIAMAELKAAVFGLVADGPPAGLTNAEIGRELGIYRGHKGHEGHISRTLLGFLEEEGVLVQGAGNDKRWTLRSR